MTPETPKPCPFCGEKPFMWSNDSRLKRHECRNAKCSFNYVAIPLSKWNHRPAESALAEEVERLKDKIAGLEGLVEGYRQPLRENN